MKVICISGKAGAGKDTTASILKEQLEAKDYRVLITHFSDLLKYTCKTFLGWDGVKDHMGRWLLQTVGTDVVRKERPDFWVNFIIDILDMFPDEWDFVLIPDLRFFNELDGLKVAGFDTTHLRVYRNAKDTVSGEHLSLKSTLTDEQKKHPSETELDETFSDYYILNDGSLEDLNNEVSNWLTDWLEGGDEPHQITLYEWMGHLMDDLF